MAETNSRRDLSGQRIVWPALFAIALATLLPACSGGQNQKAAVEAINKSLQREAISLPLSLGRVGKSCGDNPGFVSGVDDLLALPRFRAAQKAGLVTITPDGPGFWRVEGVGFKPDLVEHLKKVKHNLKDGCDSVHLAFPVAAKSVVEVVNVHAITGEKAEAEFTWNWALTPYGTKLVNALSQQERVQLYDSLEAADRRMLSDPTFSLADMTLSSKPHPGKKALKKSGDGWICYE